MASKYSVTLEKLLKEHPMNVIYLPRTSDEILITSRDVNRPGLFFAGYENYFDTERINFVGITEAQYLNTLSPEIRSQRVYQFMSKKPAAIIFTRGIDCPADILALAKEFEVPILSSTESTSGIMATLIAFLNVELAERITRHGVFVEVYGEGVLILGDSGVGKSETAVELIKRGHRLIADDAVEIKKTGAKTLVGSAPDNIRHFIELRGIGIVNARRIFGMGAVKLNEKIDMVIELEPWDADKVYDRMGIENESIEILGVRVPHTVVPIKPGRNLAIIIEVAAMNNRQKKMGYNAARELMHNLGMVEGVIPQEDELEIWGEF
ncbi:MAG: HPr(Ser) kinase/phosphatase [Clostridia bacterium]|nr:HPr(Ser) kinase/phosphatase [Clostridia bacterium]